MHGHIPLEEVQRRLEAERQEAERLPVSDVDSQYGQPNKTNHADLCLTLDQWDARELPERHFLLGSIFTTTTRAMLSARTGLGKTHLGFAFGFAIGAATSFCHWRARRGARVLIVDGEMAVELVKERLADVEKRTGCRPSTVYVLCKEDVANMPPLDTLEGQRWLDALIESLGGIDFLILDSVMALTTGDLREEESWKPVIPWMLSLTKRRIGVLWINHTGHDATRSYGTSTREWQLDVVMIAEEVDDPDADIALRLTFTKARQRRPETREDFETVILCLKDDVWTSQGAIPERNRKQGDYALVLLRRAIDEDGEKVPGEAASVRGVTLKLWRLYCDTNELSLADSDDSRERAFRRAVQKLRDAGCVRTKAGKVWIIQ